MKAPSPPTTGPSSTPLVQGGRHVLGEVSTQTARLLQPVHCPVCGSVDHAEDDPRCEGDFENDEALDWIQNETARRLMRQPNTDSLCQSCGQAGHATSRSRSCPNYVATPLRDPPVIDGTVYNPQGLS